MDPSLTGSPHRRWNPLTREWVLVSANRTQRPWQGQVEKAAEPAALHYDPGCYLCPANARAGGNSNPAYTGTFVFDNDFAALRPDVNAPPFERDGLMVAETEPGRCRVVCFSPRHDLTLARMPVADIEHVVETWTAEFIELSRTPWIRSVLIFENRGAMMGSSNPHPHGQIWANATLPNEMVKEVESQHHYWRGHGSPMLSDYLRLELASKERVVCSNEHFVALVPFWALWPFEILIVGRRFMQALDELNAEERAGLADILHQVTVRYDNLFQTSFPYTMGIHQRPVNDAARPGFQMHLHFYPPLLRSATVKKFMVGYEMLGTPQRDITAEAAAAALRALPARHYSGGMDQARDRG